ncbi:MAG: PLP-dependent aminotransferase family protein [Gammaproteobacteria bacterium]|nr:PLP-dependent aminotransferase family protein [Gammaproteobacteria bacterium]MDE2262314.1 PLP-dependent aminotransferase family protein [Gammaproteobacteria bacterium]
MQSTNYRELADTVVADIRTGKLRPGDKLPPQREFASSSGIAVSTAQRVYAELGRRGVVSGEIGRGTFVRLAASTVKPSLAEPTSLRIDLDLNFPTVPEQAALLSESLADLMRREEEWRAAFLPGGARGTRSLQSATAAFLAPARWPLLPEHLLFAGSGKQAIAAVLAATVRRGEVLGVEALTYPFIKTIAQQLGIRLFPLQLDDEGIVPSALIEAHEHVGLSAIYLQPTLHNPLGITMSSVRRAQIDEILRTESILAIEDDVYAFLDANAWPLQSLAAENVVRIDSLSKRLAPGLTLGFIIAPRRLAEDIARALHSGAWVPSSFAQTVCARWMADGTAAKITDAKRIDAAARQKLARRWLGRFGLFGNKHAYHCWLPLPDRWRADTFVAAAARHNIAVTPASAFAVAPGHAPNAVRLALSAPPVGILSDALEKLASILDCGSDALAPLG